MSLLAKGIKTSIKRSINNLGYHCTRPLLVIESDDWGSTRVPSADVLNEFHQRYPGFALNHYQALDTLDTDKDLTLLAGLLRSFRNDSGAPPVFTLNYAMANPLFDDENHVLGTPFRYEPIWETYEREQGEGITGLSLMLSNDLSDVFKPQLHGREHLNVTVWRKGIAKDEMLKQAYRMHMTGLDAGVYDGLDALNEDNTEISFTDYLIDATRLFEECFGYKSKSFIPPCYTISKREERMLADLSIHVLQSGMKVNRSMPRRRFIGIPTPMGSKAAKGQVRLVRNVQFEPSRRFYKGGKVEDVVAKTFDDIRRAINNHQPAIVCSHRVNYVGGICTQNREFSLECLRQLLTLVLEQYPSIGFLTSDELGEMILSQK